MPRASPGRVQAHATPRVPTIMLPEIYYSPDYPGREAHSFGAPANSRSSLHSSTSRYEQNLLPLMVSPEVQAAARFSFSKAERFSEAELAKDLRMNPGPGEYPIPPGMGKQVNSIRRSNRASSFGLAQPSPSDGDGEGSERIGCMPLAAAVRLRKRLAEGRGAIEALASMWDPVREGRPIGRQQLFRGLLSLGLQLTEADLDGIFSLYATGGVGASPGRPSPLGRAKTGGWGGSGHGNGDSGSGSGGGGGSQTDRGSTGSQLDMSVLIAAIADDDLGKRGARLAPGQAARSGSQTDRSGKRGRALGNWKLAPQDAGKSVAEQLRSALTRQAVRSRPTGLSSGRAKGGVGGGGARWRGTALPTA